MIGCHKTINAINILWDQAFCHIGRPEKKMTAFHVFTKLWSVKIK